MEIRKNKKIIWDNLKQSLKTNWFVRLIKYLLKHINLFCRRGDFDLEPPQSNKKTIVTKS